MSISNLKTLVKLAGHLDSLGLYKESDILDQILISLAQEGEGYEGLDEGEHLEDPNAEKKKIFVLVGPPAVGKSTWISSTFGSSTPYVINRDDIVESVASSMGWTYDDLFIAPPKDAVEGDISEKYGEVVKSPAFMTWQPLSYSKVLEANSEVQSSFTQRLSGAGSSGQDIVVDMTNMNAGARKGALKAIAGRESEYEKIAVVFPFQGSEEVIKEVAQRRAEKAKAEGRSKTIPPAAMDRMMSSFQMPTISEGFDAIIEYDNRDLLKSLASEKTASSKSRRKTSFR